MEHLADAKRYQKECSRVKSLIDLYRGEILYSIGKLSDSKSTLKSDEERGWRDHTLFHLVGLFNFLMSPSGYCAKIQYDVKSNEQLRNTIKCDECEVQTIFDQLKNEYMRTLKIFDFPIKEIPNVKRMLIALSLPDHLRLTYNTLCKYEQTSADDISKETKRARAVESNYLNQLERQGKVKKGRKGRKCVFCVVD